MEVVDSMLIIVSCYKPRADPMFLQRWGLRNSSLGLGLSQRFVKVSEVCGSRNHSS